MKAVPEGMKFMDKDNLRTSRLTDRATSRDFQRFAK
jgi:hypothetical protein